MKALRTKISTYAIALLMSCGYATSTIAGSGDFAGIYGAFTGTAGGAAINGRHVDQSGEITEGQVGGVFPTAGYEIGFNIPIGPVFFIGVGHSWVGGGTATIAQGTDNNNGGSNAVGNDTSNAVSDTSFHLKAKDLRQVYIMPSLSIFDNAAVYAKLGRSIADTELTGGQMGTPGNLTGDLYGVGTIAMAPNGIFVKTEGTVVQYNNIEIVGICGCGHIKCFVLWVWSYKMFCAVGVVI
jgi:hypothetical protein